MNKPSQVETFSLEGEEAEDRRQGRINDLLEHIRATEHQTNGAHTAFGYAAWAQHSVTGRTHKTLRRVEATIARMALSGRAHGSEMEALQSWAEAMRIELVIANDTHNKMRAHARLLTSNLVDGLANMKIELRELETGVELNEEQKDMVRGQAYVGTLGSYAWDKSEDDYD